MVARRPIPAPAAWRQALMLVAFAGAVLLAAFVLAVVGFLTWWMVAHGFGVVSFILVAFVLVFLIGGLASGRRTLRGDGTRDEAQEARVQAVVQRLCVMADIPAPEVRVPGGLPPLTWTTQFPGRRPVVTVTAAMAEQLDDRPLEAAVAHEIAHIANGDAWIMTIVAGPSTVLLSGWWASLGRAKNKAALVLFTAWMLPFLAVSMLLGRLVSRQRELAADRGAVALTGSAATLSTTLMQLSGALAQVPRRDLRSVAAADVFHLLPVKEATGIARLWATHPRLEDRITALDRLERHLQTRS